MLYEIWLWEKCENRNCKRFFTHFKSATVYFDLGRKIDKEDKAVAVLLADVGNGNGIATPGAQLGNPEQRKINSANGFLLVVPQILRGNGN